MSQPASASAIAAVRPMPRVVPVTQATRPSRRKLSSTPGTGRGYHRGRGPALARARDLARARARRRRRPSPIRARRCSCCRRTLRRSTHSRTRIASAPRCPDSAWLPLDGEAGVRRAGAAHIEVILEEDEPVAGHPRNPYHRVDALASSRHVRVTLAGETLAESTRPMVVFETDEPRASTSRRPTSARPARAERDRDDIAVPGQCGVVLGARRRRVAPATSPGRTASRSRSCRASAGLLAFRDDLVHEL